MCFFFELMNKVFKKIKKKKKKTITSLSPDVQWKRAGAEIIISLVLFSPRLSGIHEHCCAVTTTTTTTTISLDCQNKITKKTSQSCLLVRWNHHK